jgi:hypothetical protein
LLLDFLLGLPSEFGKSKSQLNLTSTPIARNTISRMNAFKCGAKVRGDELRLKARKDENHNDIRDIFIAAGASVHDTSQLGKGFPDLVIGICGFNILVEVKDGDKVPSKQKLTEDEFKFFDRWKGWTAVVRNDQDALNIIKQAKQMKAYEVKGFYCLTNHNLKMHALGDQ